MTDVSNWKVDSPLDDKQLEKLLLPIVWLEYLLVLAIKRTCIILHYAFAYNLSLMHADMWSLTLQQM
jgi:hypothetical protein